MPEQEAQFEHPTRADRIQGVEEGYGIGNDDVIGGGDGTGEGMAEFEDIRPNPDLPSIVEKMPVLAVGPPPVYPELARLSQLEGTVIVRALVGKDGKVRETILFKKVNDILDQAAVQATMGYVFVPAMQNGRPVAVWVTIPFFATSRRFAPADRLGRMVDVGQPRPPGASPLLRILDNAGRGRAHQLQPFVVP